MSETITVTQLNTRVKELFSTSPGVRDVWVNGEISGLKRYPSGHYYFTLKDSGSSVGGVLFAGSRSRLDFEPAENMKVTAFGHVDMYVPYGRYQFIVETMRRSGVGDLYLEYEKLKRKLEAEGLFDRSRKRKLPEYPRTIGVVTSEKGAVIHDIITTAASRFPADIVLAPAMVQGEGAAATIVRGIELLNRYGVDVIIVGRGGGSIEDLWAFNEEPVARAIAASRIPVVSAVGHETDFTIADFVADARAPTPTGAAAIILRDRTEVLNQVQSDMARANRAVEGVVREMNSRFSVLDSKLSPKRALDGIRMMSMQTDDLSARADRALSGTVAEMRRRYEVVDARLSPAKALDDISVLRDRIDDRADRVASEAGRRLENSASRLEAVGRRPDMAVSQSFRSVSKDLDALSVHLEGMNPLNVLGRGYSMVTSPEGEVITSVSGVAEGDTLSINFRDGSAVAEVKKKEMKR